MSLTSSRPRRNAALLCALLCVLCCAKGALAVDDVGGTLITLTNTPAAPNGAWSWFEDERAIIDDSDPSNTRLLVSSVSHAASSGSSEYGDVDLFSLNVDTGQISHFELKNRLERPDDHNSAALWVRPDGRYLAMYSTHNNDNLSRYRISVNPGDPTSWQPEVAINNGAATTYSNVYHLPNDRGGLGRTYNFFRGTNFDPTILTSVDEGATWTSSGYKLVNQGGTSQRPYARYYGDTNKIHVTITEQHPRNFDNGIYHAYIQDGQLFSSAGAVLDADLFDGSALDPNQLTPVFTAGESFGGTPMRRAWTTDVAIDSSGSPVTVFTARANNSTNDHRLFYAAFDGASWNVNEVGKAGPGLYSPEDDYTGLASIDPNDTSKIYFSTKVDPRTDLAMEHYEIFLGDTDDGGASWSWAPITFNSTVDNLRPLVPEWNENETALVWMRGNYNTFVNWDSEVVAVTDITPLDVGLSPADLNGNDLVDVEDYQLLLTSLHLNVEDMTPQQAAGLGDFDGDLRIDYDDLVFFRREYDRFNGFGALGLATSVPEPSVLALVSLGWGLMTSQSRGDRQS